MSERSCAGTLVIGCGYLGGFLLAAAPAGVRIAVTRTPARSAIAREAGARSLVYDVMCATERSALAATLGCFAGAAYVLLPPSAFGADAAGSAASALADLLSGLGVRCAVLASSTAVYAEQDGATVDEASPVTRTSPRARRLVEIEQAWLAASLDTRVVRLAGFYGPGRVIGQAAISAGEALSGSGDAWLNLVRAEDAASALIASSAAGAAPIGLISDGTPVRRADYYGYLAARMGCAAPRFTGTGGRDGSSRRCDPTATWRRLGRAPVYPDFRAGLADLV